MYHKGQVVDGIQIFDDSTGEEMSIHGKQKSVFVKIMYCIS